MAERVRIFIGCDPNDCDLEQLMVLHATLLKHSSRTLDITFMQLSRDPESFWYSGAEGQGWNTSRWATPFSGLRWGIPALLGGEGRAIYLDADIIALCDIAELWEMPMPPGKVMLAAGKGKKLRLGTLVWDCAAALAMLPPIAEIRPNARAHERLKAWFESHPEQVGHLPAAYSNLDGDHLPAGELKMLHYSDMGTQFSHRFALPRLAAEGRAHWFDGAIRPHPRPDLAALFETEYAAALAAGFSPEQYRSARPFGALRKKSERRYRGNEVTRSLLGWRWRPALKLSSQHK